jgi:fatty acid desaturase
MYFAALVMAFRYFRRINLGNGLGLNVSKSGVSTSVRTKFGSFGSKGYSIRSGITGLSYRKNFGSSRKGKNDATAFLLIMLFIGLFYLAAIVLWNLLLFIVWLFARLYFLFSQQYSLYKAGEKNYFANLAATTITILFSLLLLYFYIVYFLR